MRDITHDLLDAGEDMPENAMLCRQKRRNHASDEEGNECDEDIDSPSPTKHTPGTESSTRSENVEEYALIKNAERCGDKMLAMELVQVDMQKQLIEQKRSRSPHLIAHAEKKDARLECKFEFCIDHHKEDIIERSKRLDLDRERFESDSEDRALKRKERNTILEVLSKWCRRVVMMVICSHQQGVEF